MAGINPWRVEAIQFVQTAMHRRAASYRDRAASLSDMAQTEPNPRFRNQLADLAGQYAELANELEHNRQAVRAGSRAGP